jgi:hypothetical protein
LVGCALRRNELAEFDVAIIQQREGRWLLADLEGKVRRIRTVAIPIWVKRGINAWMTAAGIENGRLLRSVSKSGKVNSETLSDWAVWSVVEQSSKQIGSSTSALMIPSASPAPSCCHAALNAGKCALGSRYCTQFPEFAELFVLKCRTESDARKEDSVIFVLKSGTNFSRNFVRVLCATVRHFSTVKMQSNPGNGLKTNNRDSGN